MSFPGVTLGSSRGARPEATGEVATPGFSRTCGYDHNCVWPSQDRLADKMGISLSALRRYLRSLEKLRLLTHEHRRLWTSRPIRLGRQTSISFI